MKLQWKAFCLTSIIILLAFVTGQALSATLFIKFQDGSSVTYDISKINAMTFSETAQASSEGNVLFAEEFGGNLWDIWDSVDVQGGNFKKFAKLENNTLKVNVPENNSYGKTGIMTKQPLFIVDEKMSSQPYKLIFSFDPANTTNFVIALSSFKDPHIWMHQNAWFHWGQTSMTEGSAYLMNTQFKASGTVEAKTPRKAPATVEFLVYPGKVDILFPKDLKLTKDIHWLKPGTGLYLYIFTQSWPENARASFALKSVKLMQDQ